MRSAAQRCDRRAEQGEDRGVGQELDGARHRALQVAVRRGPEVRAGARAPQCQAWFLVVALARVRVLISDDVTGPACRFQAKVDNDSKAGALTSCTRQCAGTQHDRQGGMMPARAGAHG